MVRKGTESAFGTIFKDASAAGVWVPFEEIKLSAGMNIRDAVTDAVQNCYEAGLKNLLEWLRDVCPSCKEKDTFILWDTYERNLIVGAVVDGVLQFEDIRIRIHRIYCKNCRHAHAVLPDWIIPYQLLSLAVTIELLTGYLKLRKQAEADGQIHTVAKKKAELLQRFNVTEGQAQRALSILCRDAWEWRQVPGDTDSLLGFLENMKSCSLPAPAKLPKELRAVNSDTVTLYCRYSPMLADFYAAMHRSFGTGRPDPHRRRGGMEDPQYSVSFLPYLPGQCAAYRRKSWRPQTMLSGTV